MAKKRANPKAKVAAVPKRTRAKFYQQAEHFFSLVEQTAGKPLGDDCVEFALRRYAHFVWFNQPKFSGVFLRLTEGCCRKVGTALKGKAGAVIALRAFSAACRAQESRVARAPTPTGGICGKG